MFAARHSIAAVVVAIVLAACGGGETPTTSGASGSAPASGPVADLAVSLQAPSSAVGYAELPVVVTAANRGDAAARDVRLSLPVGSSVSSRALICTAQGGADCPSQQSLDARSATVTIPQLPAGSQIRIEMFVRMPAARATSSVALQTLIYTTPAVADRDRSNDSARQLIALTQPASRCAAAPQAPAVGPFKTYSGDCLLSYIVSAADWQAIQRYSVANAESSRAMYAVLDKINADFATWFRDEFDYVYLIWDNVNVPANQPFAFYYPVAGANAYCSFTDCPRRLGTLTSTFWRFEGGGDAVRSGPTLHELMHQFANRVVPSASPGHWGFSSANGQLGGYDPATLRDLGNGQYQARPFGLFANGGNSLPYSPLELYLMGLLPASATPDLQVARDAQWVDGSKGIFAASGFDTYSAERIGGLLGRLKPDPARARTAYRMAVVLVTPAVAGATDAHIALLNEAIDEFTQPQSTFAAVGYTFAGATGGRATLSADGVSTWRK